MSQSNEFADKRVVVMGLGRFGGGIGVTRFLVGRGAEVLVTDKDPADKLANSVAQLQHLIDAGSVSLRLGEHNVSDFTTCDLVVVNPAVQPGNRFVRAAEAAGIEVTTEMRLLVQRLPNRLRTIGVTGSAGKSTVTAMIGHVLEKAFSISDGGFRMADGQAASSTVAGNPKSPRIWVGGNIGGSLLPHLDQIGEDDWVVLELSSFMLERLKKDAHFPGWSPHIAVITNISPNHLDWHGSMEAYVAAKQVIHDYQSEETADACFGGQGTHTHIQTKHMNFWLEDKQDIFCTSPSLELMVPGKHNQVNARLCSLAIQAAIGGEEWTTWQALEDFPGLPHRLQRVAEHNGVRYFNDSKCTTPEAAQLAIQAFTEDDSKPGIHLILGGKDKGSDLKPLAGFAAQHCKAIYTIGAMGGGVATAAEAVPVGAERPESCGGVSWPAETAEVVRCGDLETAMAEIHKRVVPGDVVLLSPACASWDQFDHYEQRGERFIELVKVSIGQ